MVIRWSGPAMAPAWWASPGASRYMDRWTTGSWSSASSGPVRGRGSERLVLVHADEGVEERGEAAELLEMGGGDGFDAPGALGRQGETDQAVVGVVALALHQAEGGGPLDQPDGAVVTDEEVAGHVGDGGPLRPRMTADGDEQLVLGGAQPHLGGLLLAPGQEAPQCDAERQQRPPLA